MSLVKNLYALCLLALCAYSCDIWKNDQTLKEGICLQSQTSGQNVVYSTKLCKENEQCKVDNDVGTCVQSQYWPGEACQSNQQCITSKCEKNICKGSLVGEACTDHSQCDPGLFCDSNLTTCALQAKENEACTEMWQCQNHLTCDGLKCVKLFSLSNAQLCQQHKSFENTFVIKDFSWACNSMNCVNTGIVGEYKCQSPVDSQNNPPAQCTDQANCPLVGGGNANCGCPVSTQDQQYCEVTLLEKQPIDFHDTWVKYIIPKLQDTSGKCNTLGRFRYNCLQQFFDSITLKTYAGSLLYEFLPTANYGIDADKIDDSTLFVTQNYYGLYEAKQYLDQSPSCNFFQCAALEQDKCATSDTQTGLVKIQACKEGYYCPVSDGQVFGKDFYCEQIEYNQQTISYAGMFCRGHKDCITGLCHSFKCIGKKEGESCTKASECDVGLACIETEVMDVYSCQSQITTEVSETRICYDDNMCVNNAVCRNGKCYKQFSQPDSTIINTVCKDKQESVCAHFTCEPSEDKSQCVDDYVSLVNQQTDLPLRSDSEWYCRSTNDNSNINYTPLKCDFKAASTYCDLHTGDQVTESYIQSLSLIQDLDQGICHTQARLDILCWQYQMKQSQLDSLVSYWQKYFEWKYYPALTLAESCTVQVAFPSYWKVKQQNIQVKSFPQLICHYHSCSDDQHKLGAQECAKYFDTDDKWVYNQCEEQKECEVAGNSGSCVAITSNTKNYPGMTCKSDDQCIDDVKCVDQQCKGKYVDELCKGSEDFTCDVGLACRKQDSVYKCLNQISTVDQVTCENDWQCVNSAVCRGGKCQTPYTDEVCSTMTCVEEGQNAKCINAFSYDNRECAYDSDCLVQNSDGFSQQTTCICGNNGTAYCTAFTGSYQALNYIKASQKVLIDQGKCHTHARRNPDCWVHQFHEKTNIDNIYSYKLTKQEYQDYPGIQTSDTCTLQVLYQDYYVTSNTPHYPEDWSLECSSFSCYNTSETGKAHQWTNGECIAYDTNSEHYDIHLCEDDDDYCPEIMNKQSSKCQKEEDEDEKYTLYPGFKCDDTEECIKGLTCHKGKCLGKSIGEACDGPTDPTCDVGLACIFYQQQYKCAKQIDITEITSCENDFQCVNYGVCRNQTCREYFSFQKNQKYQGTCDSSKIDYICSSFTCEQFSTKEAMCTTSYNSDLVKCGADIDCTLTNSENLIWKGECRCAKFTNQYQSYCSASSGSKVALDYIEAFKKVYRKDQQICHSMKRRDTGCWEENFEKQDDINNIWNLVAQEELFKNYPSIQNADSCTLQVYYPRYWDAKYDEHDYDGAYLNLFYGITLVLLYLL